MVAGHVVFLAAVVVDDDVAVSVLFVAVLHIISVIVVVCHLVDLPVDPYRYRYSPERLKKASSFQSDEFPRDSRHGRRQSGDGTSINKAFVSTLLDR